MFTVMGFVLTLVAGEFSFCYGLYFRGFWGSGGKRANDEVGGKHKSRWRRCIIRLRCLGRAEKGTEMDILTVRCATGPGARHLRIS